MPSLKHSVALLSIGLALLVAPGVAAPRSAAQAVLPDGQPLCGTEAPGAGAPVPAADDGVLRVATFNVLHSETDEGDLSLGARIPLLADAIAGSGADVVGSQEVTRNLTFAAGDEYPQRHGVVAQRLAAAIAARSGQPWAWCWSLSNPHVPLTPDLEVGGGNVLDQQAAARGNTPDPGDFSEGLAVFSRYPIETSRFRRLLPRSYEAVGCVEPDPFCPLDAIFDSRQVLWARITTPAGGVDLFSTHIAHHLTELSDETKRLQVQQVVAITAELAAADPLPDFLVGDFNSAPGGPAMTVATNAGFVDSYAAFGGAECSAFGAPGCSGGPTEGEEVWTAAVPRPMGERIDYVLARPPAGCSLGVTDARRIGDTPLALDDGRFLWPSDHYGFVSQTICAEAAPGPAVPVNVTTTTAPGAGAAAGASGSGLLAATGGSVAWLPVLLLLAVGLLGLLVVSIQPGER